MEGFSKASLKMNQPGILPTTGLTSIAFKRWPTWVINYLDQDLDFGQFLEDGRYPTWAAASSSPRGKNARIVTLFARTADSPVHHRGDDVTDAQAEAVAIKTDPTVVAGENSFARMSPEDKTTFKDDLILRRVENRNRQLNKMLQILSSFVQDNEAGGIMQNSTSLDWVWAYLQSRYNIETKGVNFLKIVKHSYKAGDDPITFYTTFRASFVDNLRKKGDSRNHLMPGDVMEADETMSPSQEDTVVLWTLDKIDPRLPNLVARMYEHRLDKKTHLIDLAPLIFQQVPNMLETLEREASLAAMASSASLPPEYEYDEGQPLPMAAFYPRGRGGSSSGRGRGAGFRGGPSRGTYPRISPVTGRAWTTKMCRICEEKQKPPSVVASHNTAECDSISKSERRGMLATLQAMDLLTTNDDDYSDLMGGDSGQEGLAQGLQYQPS